MDTKKKIQAFTSKLANHYTPFFDVYRDEVIADIPLSFLAIYKRRDERYMITKKIKVYAVENQQLVFTTSCDDHLDGTFFKKLQLAMEKTAMDYIPKHEEHMSTIVLGLVVVNQHVDEAIIKEVRRFRKLKFLKFGLHGWIEMYWVLINLLDNTIAIHPKGKSFVSSIEKILKEEESWL